jgi:hypothetical protein
MPARLLPWSSDLGRKTLLRYFYEVINNLGYGYGRVFRTGDFARLPVQYLSGEQDLMHGADAAASLSKNTDASNQSEKIHGPPVQTQRDWWAAGLVRLWRLCPVP